MGRWLLHETYASLGYEGNPLSSTARKPRRKTARGSSGRRWSDRIEPDREGMQISAAMGDGEHSSTRRRVTLENM